MTDIHEKPVPDENEQTDDLDVEYKEFSQVEDHIGNDRAFKGDDSDGKVNWTTQKLIAALSLGLLFAGSQSVLYMMGGSLGYVEASLGAQGRGGWLPVANTLAITAVAPFTGYLQDLVGRRMITIIGSCIICSGIAIVGSSHVFGQAVAGMAIAGSGAGICELAAMAALSDIVPVKHRAYILALMTGCITPFAPYVLYAQLISSRSSWRWGIWMCLFWNAIALTGVVCTYFPKGHPRMEGVSRRKVIARIDYVGVFLSIVGLTITLVALQAGGYTHPWRSAYVLVQLIVGIVLIITWVVWEWKFAKYPMAPKQIFQGQRVVTIVFGIAFVAGFNFYSLINFYPLAFSTMYDPDPTQIGLRALGYGFALALGSSIFNSMISTPVEARWTLLVGTTLMTAFGGALAATNPTNAPLLMGLGTFAALGVGGITACSGTVALMVVPDSLLATTAALSLSIRTLGGSIGYTIYLAVFSNKLTSNLPRLVAQYAIQAGLDVTNAEAFVTTFLTNPSQIASAPGYTPEIAMAATMGSRWAYSESLKWVWYVSIPFGLLAMLSCFFLPSIKKFKTSRIAVEF